MPMNGTASLNHIVLGAAMLLSAFAAHAKAPDEKEAPVTLLFVGGAAGDDQSPTLTALKARLESLDPKIGIVVFTGNYSDGELPLEGDEGRAKAEAHVLMHVEATQDFVKRGGKVYFLAGHRDFADGGTLAIRRLRSFLNQSYQAALGSSDDAEDTNDLDVMPLAGCGDPTLLELNKHVGLLLLDSQWWMQDWANDPQANEGCEVKTRTEFQEHLLDALRGYRTRRLIVATHHPLRSNGEFGGSFTAGAHVRPAPVLGTVWVWARQLGLAEQYQNHPMVRSYLDLVLAEAQLNGSYVFASGHDPSLQYVRVEKQVQIVAGTSARSAGPTVDASPGDFALSSPGWAEIAMVPSGEGELTLVSGEGGRTVFASKLPELAVPGTEPTEPPKPFPAGQVTSTFTKKHVWQLGSFVQFFAGSYYSDAYALKLQWETLNLETEQGGLTIKGLAGAMQTNSLKLRDPRGGEWVARAVTKESSRYLPWPQNQATFVNRLLEHGDTAIHPEGALSLPRLSQALGLLHASPRLLYLPDQERLGRYRGFITDEVVMLEQRPHLPKEGVAPESLVGPPSAVGKTHFRTTDETIAKTIANPDKHQVDQEEMLRARLLDMFVGDWDRHKGQWRFAAIANPDGTKTYRPIARDRDQVFANYDGLGLIFVRIASPDVRRLQPFTGDYGSIGWLNYNARNIDPVLLNQIPRSRWLEVAREVRDSLTDEVIDEAMSTWHQETYALDGARIAAALKARRDKLVAAADEYFGILSRNVDILGSSKDDQFDLWFEDGGAVRVAVRRKDKEGKTRTPFFDRVFDPSQTRELRIYALEGDDTLVVHGNAPTSIEVRFVGGPGHDEVSAAAGSGAGPLEVPALHVYDSLAGATIDPSIKAHDERSDLPQFNEFDQNENHEYDYGTFFPSLEINPDYGAWIGGRYTYTVQGYKKHPFAARHQFTGAFATATLGVALDYRGLFPQSAGPADQQVDLVVKPNTTRNFLGLTNQYGGDAAAPDYYRVRQGWYEARYSLVGHPGGDWTRFGGQLFGQAVVTEATSGRYVSASPAATDALGPRYFAGARVFAELNTFDDPILPKRGIALHASAEGRSDLVRTHQFSLTWKGAAAAAFPFDRQRRLVLVTRASIEGIVGDYPFYFAPTLGGTDLRAYRFQQLAGDNAFAHTTDLRLDVIRIYSGLPGTIGLNLSIDHGRVFGPSTTSNVYHLNCGGGVWWSIMDVVGVSLNYYRGLDGGSRFVFAMGPLFSQTGF